MQRVKSAYTHVCYIFLKCIAIPDKVYELSFSCIVVTSCKHFHWSQNVCKIETSNNDVAN